MGLDPSAENHLGRLLAVKPVYGWGWSRLDAPEIPVPAQINGVPHPFHCRIHHFFAFQGELRGAVGVVQESGHIYEGLWVIFSTRGVQLKLGLADMGQDTTGFSRVGLEPLPNPHFSRIYEWELPFRAY